MGWQPQKNSRLCANVAEIHLLVVELVGLVCCEPMLAPHAAHLHATILLLPLSDHLSLHHPCMNIV